MALPIVLSIVLSFLFVVEARIPGVYSGGAWQSAHATFYGGSDASGTMGLYSHFTFLTMYLPKQPIFPLLKTEQHSVLTMFSFISRRSLWVWELVQPRVWSEYSCIEHSIVQQWLELWCVL